MSHEASNWAFNQTYLDSDQWRVLVLLADCYSPPENKSCIFSRLQDRLGKSPNTDMHHLSAERILEIMRSLEALGLLRRHELIDDELHFELLIASDPEGGVQ